MTIDLPTSLGGEDPRADALTHVDEQGQAHMVDITGKSVTRRLALARCLVITAADANRVLASHRAGMDVVEVARVSGMQAAKQTSSLIPLCHPVRLDRVAVEVDVTPHCVTVSALAEIVERTGVEMEALTACAMCALSLLKVFVEVDPAASMEQLTLWHKSGGRSGEWSRTSLVGLGPARPVPAAVPVVDTGPSP